MANIRRKCTSFEVQQHEFREEFRQTAPFAYTTPDPYEQLDGQHLKISQLEDDMAALYKSAGLFEVSLEVIRDHKKIQQKKIGCSVMIRGGVG